MDKTHSHKMAEEELKTCRDLMTRCQVQYTESAFAYAITHMRSKSKGDTDMKSIIDNHNSLLLARKNGSTEAMIHRVLFAEAKRLM